MIKINFFIVILCIIFVLGCSGKGPNGVVGNMNRQEIHDKELQSISATTHGRDKNRFCNSLYFNLLCTLEMRNMAGKIQRETVLKIMGEPSAVKNEGQLYLYTEHMEGVKSVAYCVFVFEKDFVANFEYKFIGQ